ncbi:MAG: cob(I)yrinic acid a,c-diamide adenosyltransferase [Candidatus Ratteibacteria bacterium]
MKNKRERIVHIYTGEGKGKSTCAVGLAVRALSYGWKVGFFQFFKVPGQGELVLLKKLGVVCRVECPWYPGMRGGVLAEECGPIFSSAWKKVRSSIQKSSFDLVVLDEILIAVRDGLIPQKDLEEFLLHRPENTEIVLTGRWDRASSLRNVELVTEMVNIRHPWPDVAARKGIDF